jgi:hypothetical protein
MPTIINAGTTALTVTPDATGALALQANGITAVTVDTSQRVLIGTTSASGFDSGADDLVVGSGSGSTGMTIYSGSTGTAAINFADGTSGSAIYAGGITYNHTDNRMDFSTTDGSGRMRIDNQGRVGIGCVPTGSVGTTGLQFEPDGAAIFTRVADTSLFINRKTSDGTLVSFNQDGTQEGSISVSGTTVSYNGGHLARWAQIPNGNTNTILKGTVLSNLDEMNEYIDSEGNAVDNEQLNQVKVSDVEGDANVAGVFVSWSYDEAHDVDEINMAMTGDMIIRIAEGVTVQRGDLLMSAGDGTAKPQGDDIVRSKTIAKVTSTHITCTYEDGSYCVPCVLMAC